MYLPHPLEVYSLQTEYILSLRSFKEISPFFAYPSSNKSPHFMELDVNVNSPKRKFGQRFVKIFIILEQYRGYVFEYYDCFFFCTDIHNLRQDRRMTSAIILAPTKNKECSQRAARRSDSSIKARLILVNNVFGLSQACVNVTEFSAQFSKCRWCNICR